MAASCCFEKLVAEVGESSLTQRKGLSAVGSLYRATINEDISMDTRVCVTVIGTV
jgi:hypothetical protein